MFPGDEMPFPCRVLEQELGPLLLLMPLSMPCSAGECGHINQCSGSFSVGYKVGARRASVAEPSSDRLFLGISLDQALGICPLLTLSLVDFFCS